MRNVAYLVFMDQTVAVNSLTPPSSVVHQNNLALSGEVTGPYNVIDSLNLEASYSDLIHAFGTNTQAIQNWFNNNEAKRASRRHL